VKPAIRARRRRPSADVISQLLQQGFNDLEILTEALTYAAAGMATTREFITMAAWHLLDEPDLRNRYLIAERVEREAILHEILRLDPWSVSSDARPGSRSPCIRSPDR
jgi:cytochrome P450